MAALGTSSGYQYEKLPDGHIRLLKLRPGPRPGMPAIAEIFSCLLEDSPEYEALSYVWDKPLCTRAINFGEGRQIRVPVNVFLALKWLQQQTSERLMWIDAICINQDQVKEATEEREVQVKMMGKIYAKAKTVFIYFGTSAARYNTKAIGRLSALLQNDEVPLDETDLCVNHLLYKFSGEEYFKRTWTIQEIILAKEVFILLGDSLLPWSKLFSKISGLSSAEITFQEIPMVRVQRLLKNYRSPRLLDLLRVTSASEATDQRDKIYALLGLIKGDPEHYPVKYDPWTEAMVFAYYTFRFCEERNSLDVLEKSRHIAPTFTEQPTSIVRLTSIEGLPSWANDFTRTQKWRRQKAIDEGWYSNSSAWFKLGFSAHDHLPLSIKFELGQDLALDSQGRKVGEISFVSRRQFTRHDYLLFRDLELTMSEHLIHLTDNTRPFAEWSCPSDFLVALLCTQICDPGDTESKIEELVREEVRSFSAEKDEELKSLVQRLVEYFTGRNSVRSHSAEHMDIEDLQSLVQRLANHFLGSNSRCSHLTEHMLKCCEGNSLFTTDNPFVGLGSCLALPGDIVCVLNGGRTPFILRRTNTTKKEYELVCECYVYGIMQGEWMRDVKEDDLERFRLV